MSGSPTWAEMQLEKERQRKLEEERRRKAEEERRRREEAERRAREELEARLREEMSTMVQSLNQRLSQARGMGTSTPIPYLEPEIERIRAHAGTSAEGMAAALSRLGQLRLVLDSVIGASVQAEKDRQAMQDLVRSEAAAEARRLRQEAETRARLDAEAARLQAVLHEAATAKAARIAELRVTLATRLAGLDADEVTTTWEGAALASVRAAVEHLETSENPDTTAQDLNRKIDEALARAQVRQLAEERRAYIVESLRAGLANQGFRVGDAVLVSDSLDAEVSFRAVRADRRWVDVNVSVDGPVIYEVDGTDRRVERAPDGNVYSRCDETEARLEALHADLAEQFGIQAGELLWEAKDPNRNKRNANALPSGGPSATRSRG